MGLSAKLLVLTALFAMLAEILIFLPSVANFRVSWLTDRLTAARLAGLAAEAGQGTVPDGLRMDLLQTAQVKAVAIKRDNQRRVVLPPDRELAIDASYDLTPMHLGFALSSRIASVSDALAVFLRDGQRIVRVTGQPVSGLPLGPGGFVEIVLPEAPLKAAMVSYALNILALSIIISLITAALVYFALNRLLVQPMRRITRNMLYFSQNPEDASRVITPSARTDEIGTAERELANMQGELSQLLQQKTRLAQLGLAVSKINHDLRNMLSSAQLISDRLRPIPDPTVQRFVPKLISSLDRAIAFCNDTLRYGKAGEQTPRREPFALAPLLGEVSDGLALPRERLGLVVDLDKDLAINADREQMYRVLNNIVRNAVQALEGNEPQRPGKITIVARRARESIRIEIIDNGPGVPAKARAHLFEAFQGGARAGGTGLGLAIAHEIITAHGGTLRLGDTGGSGGTSFVIELPVTSATSGSGPERPAAVKT